MLNQKMEYSSSLTSRQFRSKAFGSAITVAVFVPLLAMTGCANYSKRHFTVGSVQDSYKTRHPVVIDQREQTLDIPIASGTYNLPVADKGTIQGFAYRFKKSGTDVLTILLPQGSPNARSARKISPVIVDAITSNGVSENRIRLVNYDASAHGSSAPVRLSYQAVTANVGECGKWTEDLAGSNIQNKNYGNFGCANQKNFAAMIANPADLIAPRGMSEIDAQRRDVVIEDYRNGDTRLGGDLNSSLR